MKFRNLGLLLIALLWGTAVRAEDSPEDALAKMKAAEAARVEAAARRPADSGTSQPATQAIQGHSTSKPRSDELEETFDNGKVKAHYKLSAGGIKWGPYTLYCEDGKIGERGSYKNGQLDGERQVLYPSGQIQLREQYKAGQREGVLQEYDEKGRVTHVVQYRAGEIARDQHLKDGVAISDQTFVEGLLVLPRSPEMIVRELKNIATAKVETIAASETIPAHEGGNDSQEDRENAVRELMQYRYLCQVPYEKLALDPVYNAHDEAAVGILKVIGKLDHKPANPGWAEDRYQYAFEGTSHSNLHMSSRGGALCKESVDSYMDDSDSVNIDRLGHRRWCLNPGMGKVGFASHGGYSAMWSFDVSRREIPEFEFVAYPAPGAFPNTHFHPTAAWSVSLNESKFRPPVEKAVKVTITPVEVQMTQNKIKPLGKALDLDYFHVDVQGFGIRNCIIFRPAGIKAGSAGAYLVEISGLESVAGKASSIKYVILFFKP